MKKSNIPPRLMILWNAYRQAKNEALDLMKQGQVASYIQALLRADALKAQLMQSHTWS